MKNLHFVLLFSFFIFSCQIQNQTENPLVAKHQVQYEATKSKMLANKSDIIRLIEQLPPGYQNAIQKGIASIEKYDLSTLCAVKLFANNKKESKIKTRKTFFIKIF